MVFLGSTWSSTGYLTLRRWRYPLVADQGCAVEGCDLDESEHWFEYGQWKPHQFEPKGVA